MYIPHTTTQQLAAANARCLLESEPLEQFKVTEYTVYSPNPEAYTGLVKWNVDFVDGNGKVTTYDGVHWNN